MYRRIYMYHIIPQQQAIDTRRFCRCTHRLGHACACRSSSRGELVLYPATAISSRRWLRVNVDCLSALAVSCVSELCPLCRCPPVRVPRSVFPVPASLGFHRQRFPDTRQGRGGGDFVWISCRRPVVKGRIEQQAGRILPGSELLRTVQAHK